MKYIRTKDGIYNFEEENNGLPKMPERYGTSGNCSGFPCIKINKNEDIIKQADTIEELCDRFVMKTPLTYYEDAYLKSLLLEYDKFYCKKDIIIYGAIWTSKGLIYKAKMNNEGVLVLL